MYETIFAATGALAMVGWAGLMLAPRAQWVVRVAARLVIPTLIAVVYVWLMLSHLDQAPAEGGFGSLAAVSALYLLVRLGTRAFRNRASVAAAA